MPSIKQSLLLRPGSKKGCVPFMLRSLNVAHKPYKQFRDQVPNMLSKYLLVLTKFLRLDATRQVYVDVV